MNTIKKFVNPLFGEVRIMTNENGQVWFVGKDVAEALGYKDTKKAIQLHVDDEDKLRGQIASSGQMRDMMLISESGLYALILSSKLSQAKAFKRWVTNEVLPQIRKTGGYIPVSEHDDEKDTLCKAIDIFKRTVQKQADIIQAQLPKVKFANEVQGSKSSILVRDLAKLLTQNGIKIGQMQLFYWLRTHGYLFQQNSRPLQKWVNKGLFELSEGLVNVGHYSHIHFTTKITPKGQQYFLEGFMSGKFCY